MHGSSRKSESVVRMVRLMGNRPIKHNKVKQRIIHLVFDHLFHLSATLLQMAKFPVSTPASRAAWSINRAMVKWAILQQTPTHIRPTLKATHNTLNNVSSSHHNSGRTLTFKAAAQPNHTYQ
jgi:hypothetical protein